MNFDTKAAPPQAKGINQPARRSWLTSGTKSLPSTLLRSSGQPCTLHALLMQPSAISRELNSRHTTLRGAVMLQG
jgi:hypothetical protein